MLHLMMCLLFKNGCAVMVAVVDVVEVVVVEGCYEASNLRSRALGKRLDAPEWLVLPL